MKKKYLLAPGPTRVPEVSLAKAAKCLFQTKQDILIFAATATAGDIL